MESPFCLLDVIGGTRHFDFHSQMPVLVYDAGSVVILWNIAGDTKTNLIEHVSDITAVKFSKHDKILYSVEGGHEPSVCVWDWTEGALLKHTNLPPLKALVSIRECYVIEAKAADILLIIECYREGYRVTCWDSTSGMLNFLHVTDLDPAATCLSAFFTSSNGTFATAEDFCIKLWNVSSTSTSLFKRIHLSQSISSATFSALIKCFIVLSVTGAVILISEEGKYLSSIVNRAVPYTSVLTTKDLLFVGNKEGAVEVYNGTSLALSSTIPFADTSRDSLLISSEKKLAVGGPSVLQIFSNGINESIAIVYQDYSVSVIDTNTHALINHMFGHYMPIMSTKFSPRNSHEFFTCSKDMSIYHWKHSGDRWVFTYFDIPRLIDPSLRYYRFGESIQTAKESLKSPGFTLTALAISPKYEQLACGSNKGSVWIFDTSSGTLLLHRDVASVKIVGIEFSPSGTYLAIAYGSGLINLYRFYNDLEFVLQLEDPLIVSEAFTGHIYISIILSILPDQVFSVAEQTFMSYSTHNFATVRAHKILVDHGKATKDVLADFYIDEGKVSGFDLHPSNEYIVISSDSGYFYIYNTHLAQLRGKVKTGPSPWGCRIEPSGLYVFLTVSSFIEEKNDNANRIMQVFELGTGGLAAELANICDISSFDISSDGKYMTIASNKGSVFVWGMNGDIRENMQQVLDYMAANPEFWKTFPIDLRTVEITKEEIMPEEGLRNTMGYPIHRSGENQAIKELEEKPADPYGKFQRKATFKEVSQGVNIRPKYEEQKVLPPKNVRVKPDPEDVDKDSTTSLPKLVEPEQYEKVSKKFERWPGMF